MTDGCHHQSLCSILAQGLNPGSHTSLPLPPLPPPPPFLPPPPPPLCLFLFWRLPFPHLYLWVTEWKTSNECKTLQHVLLLMGYKKEIPGAPEPPDFSPRRLFFRSPSELPHRMIFLSSFRFGFTRLHASSQRLGENAGWKLSQGYNLSGRKDMTRF